MTAVAMPLAGAPSTTIFTWEAINWQKVGAHVRQLQMRIAKAFPNDERMEMLGG